ncbi:chitobiase/beta-hexosaminidase C-terminal domain-containing protein [Arenibacter algicola]|uniref:chitobiase/beta-hexosaminidase C-terminal domain-containing protein n=1 Tax=Arenibacter algicola TaxID=616991 RepID=UPI001C0796BC|nr:chitobiase/beta-hexosaminidase C-terminal domain-containing protein [Arenibacter algicola]MBU2903974.1 chitobiase/beta-hexosaminidase C-terminal domain-containing protein [Arenibacter algicola]
MILQIISLGRLHPLLVHLPIGILVLAFLMELYFRKKNSGTENDIIKFTLAIAAASTVLSVASGWLLGEEGGYDETLLFRHRWMAVGLAIGTTLLYFIKKYPKAWSKNIYLPLFISVMALLGLTGHYGGSMTHGEDYLYKNEKAKKVVITDVDNALVFNDIIMPILDEKCVSCHNPNKVKGGLIMTNKEQLLLGGESGSLLVAEKDEVPRLIHHIKLPMEDEDHMPPKGKVQLTNHEIQLLEWWIGHENCFDCVAGTLDKTEKINDILNSLEEDTSTRALIAKEVEMVPEDWLASININGPIITKLAEKNPLLIVNLSGNQSLEKNDLKALKKHAENIVELNLGNSNFNDTISSYLTSFKNLTKLQLQNTKITDKSMASIGDLKHLESLNIYGTDITDQGLEKLTALNGLKTLYPWNSKITKEALDHFSNKYKGVTVVSINEDLFTPSSLEPPSIIADTDFFKDSIEVTLDYFFKGVDLYYTLDGSEPDTTSTKYNEPILLTTSTQLKAVSHKSGWELSPVKTVSFKKSNILPNSITLNNKPNEKYKGNGGNTLIDLKRGTINFVDGNWIGYEGSNFAATLKLQKEELISTVSVGAFSSPEKWIFYPTGFKVWVSQDGNNFKLVHTEKVPTEKPNSDTKFQFFDLNIPPTKSTYVKVEVISQLKNPSWHANPGGKSWLFVDEIVLN